MTDNLEDSQKEKETEKYKQYYNLFIDERKLLLETKFKTSEALDKYILTLSGGALGLSLTFINQVFPDIKTETLYLLKLSWGSYCLSILSVLIGMILSQNAFSDQIKLTQEYFLNNGDYKQSKLSNLIKHLNFSAIGFFILATVFLACFAINNLS